MHATSSAHLLAMQPQQTTISAQRHLMEDIFVVSIVLHQACQRSAWQIYICHNVAAWDGASLVCVGATKLEHGANYDWRMCLVLLGPMLVLLIKPH
jgi:hypothetical protein